MANLNIGNSLASVAVNTKHNGSVTPQINNTYNLGTSDLRWKNIYGNLKGNADTATAATKLATTRTISLTGSVTGSGTFDGSGNLNITTTTNHTHNYAGSASAGGSANSAVKLDTATAGDSNTPVYFSGGKPVACTSLDLNTSGNAATATKLATARSISLDTGVTSTATSFDGSNNITIPINSIKESYLTWGGRNFNGAYGCIDAAMVSDLGANRLMFGKAAGITIQYSTDGGNNWTDYGASNSEKVGLFSSGHGFRIGKATKDTITANCMLRVIINTDNFGVYTQLNKFVIYLSTEGCNGCYCTIDASLESSPTIFTTFANKVPVSGWSGYNVINTSYITTYGNSPSNQYGLIRFTFGCTSVNTNYPGLNIIQIMGFGGVGWGTPSTMAKTGHLYSYDSSQNAAFPATVTAPTFSGALLGNASTATKATQDSAGQQINTTYIKGLSVSGKTITYTKGDGTTGTITTQDNNTTYSAGTGLSLSGTTFNHKNSVTAATAQGDASKTLTFGGTFTIPTITYDAQGHITGKGTTTMTMPANPNTDTHWTTGITAGETGTTSNSATTNGNTFIKIKDNSTHRGQIKLVGSGATSVSSNAEGVITISSTDNNTTYGSMSVSEGTTGTATTNRVLTAANLKGIINAHAPTKTGGGASGTWGISISGNAASASKVNNKLAVGSKSYDGSAAVTIEARDLGLASAMLFLGTTTTAITDGATTNPVAISGSNKTVTAGNVVLYGSKEFVWTGSAWEELGNEGSYKIVQAAVADPSASGTSNTFIDTISQDTNGKITATKKTVAVTNSAPTLAWSTTSTVGTVAGTNLQVKMPANPNTDTKVTQTAINAADYTNWRPLIWGSSNSGTEGFTPSTVTDGVYTAQTLSCQPSTGAIRATTFKGSLSGNADTATKAIQDSDGNAINSTYLKKRSLVETSQTSVTSGSSAGTSSALILYGTTYGNDAAYLKTSGKMSYGDPGPQIQFSSVLSGGQRAALIFTDHDSIGTGVSLSLVSTESDAYLIAPHIKALTGFIGNLSGNATTMSYPLGFSIRELNNWTNGEFVSDGFTTFVTDWAEPSGGSIYWASNSKGQLAAGVDGYFYQGRDVRDKKLHRCLDTYDLSNSKWGNSDKVDGYHASQLWRSDGGTWNPGANISLEASSNGQEWSFDIHRNGHTGCYWHVWDESHGTMLRVSPDDGKVSAPYGFLGAVWNDYAEYRCSNVTEPGRVIIENGDGTLSLSTERLQRGAEIISDTFGFAIGETDECKTPVAVSGRVLAYYSGDIKEFKPGYPVCSGPNGTVSVMTEEEEEKYPSRIIGTVSEIPTYEKWGTGNVEVNGRIWIRIR